MTDPDPVPTPTPTPTPATTPVGTSPAPQDDVDDDDNLPDDDPRKKKKSIDFSQLSSSQQIMLSIFMLLFGNFLHAEDAEAAQGRDPQQDPVLQQLNSLFAGALNMDPTGKQYNDLTHNMRTPGYDWHNDKPLVTHLNNSGALKPDGSITSFVKNPPKSLLDLIAGPESGGQYNVVCGGRHVDLTHMTINQVLDWQSQQHQSAAGRYQIIRSTLAGLKKDMGLTGNEKFDEAMQDRMGTVLMQRRGLDKFLKGEMSQQAFMNNLAHEWASLPKDNSGRAAYGGISTNPTMALVSPAVVNTVLADARNKYQSGVSASGSALASNTTGSIKPPFKAATTGTDTPTVVASNTPDPKKVPGLNA